MVIALMVAVLPVNADTGTAPESSQPTAQKPVLVAVAQMWLHAEPGFLSVRTSVLEYGARLRALGALEHWVEVAVSDTGQRGWVHTSGVLDPARYTWVTPATADVLRGHGFSVQVEERYAREHGLDLSLVDQMESWSVAPERLRLFLTSGNIVLEAGE
jgi:hypothetical protein